METVTFVFPKFGFSACHVTGKAAKKSARQIQPNSSYMLVMRVVYVTIASIWCENMFRYLSAGIICFEKRTVFRERSSEENCELRGIDNVQGQISQPIFAPTGGYCVYYSSNLFRNARSFENWGIFSDIPQFQLGLFCHVTCLDQSRASENI